MNLTKSSLQKMARMHNKGQSFEAIGSEFGISGSWARQQLIAAGLHTPTQRGGSGGGGGARVAQRRQPTGTGRRGR